MRRDNRWWLAIVGVTLALVLGTAATAKRDDDGDTEGDTAVIEVDEAAIFFEYNFTDQDLGLHVFFDAPAWIEMEIHAPGENGDDDDDDDDRGSGRGRSWGSRWGKGGWQNGGGDDDDDALFEVENGGALRDIGSTELFSESAEPELCPDDEECSEEDIAEAIAEFQENFPEGSYEFEGETVEGDELEGEAELSWDLPDPVEIDLSAFPTISWTASTGPEVVGYQVIVEAVVEDEDGEEREVLQATDLPAGVLTLDVSPQFVQAVQQFETDGTLVEHKVEILAVGANGNKTITEEALFEAD